jgi:predicted protein tyrosine phosphatase
MQRSPTAAKIYSKNYETKSAGASNFKKDDAYTREILDWAEEIYVMEKPHRNKIHKVAIDIYESKKITCLYIPDEYDFMEPHLIKTLEEKLTKYLGPTIKTENSEQLRD